MAKSKVRKNQGRTLPPWEWVAKREARTAYENHFSVRRDWISYDDEGAIVYYDNNPFAADSTARGRMVDRAVARLAEEGIEVLARATYPEAGESKGYTLAVVFGTHGDCANEALVQEIMDEELTATIKELCELDKKKQREAVPA